MGPYSLARILNIVSPQLGYSRASQTSIDVYIGLQHM